MNPITWHFFCLDLLYILVDDARYFSNLTIKQRHPIKSNTFIRGLILTGFALAAAGVLAIGYYAWQQFDGLVVELKQMAEPNVPIKAMQAIRNDLLLAENSVRTFNITRNDTVLDEYRAAYDSIESQVNQLHLIHSNTAYTDTATALTRIDILRGIINRKVSLQEQLIEIIKDESQEGVGEVLESINTVARDTVKKFKVVTTESTKDTLVIDTTKVVTKGFLGLGKPRVKTLKKPKKRKNNFQDTLIVTTIEQSIDTIAPLSSANVMIKIKRSTEDIQKRIQEIEAQKIAAIRQITTRDQQKMDSLSTLLVEMEEIEQILISSRTREAATRTDESKSFILRFIIASLAVFLFLIVVIFRDMTLNRRLQRRLSAAKAHAEKLAKAKEEFLANMSHEIRTPMNAIIGFTEQLSQTQLSKVQHTFLSPVRHSAQYLLALINDVLDYSKLESGKFTLEEIAFAPHHVLREVYETFRDRAENKGLELRLSPAENLPVVLIGDPLRLKQMLFNLINNAIKFTDQGHVELKCEAMTPNAESVSLRFQVIDTGTGIPQEKLKTIFTKFTQADSSTTRKYGGTGLGLAITQELAELHGGEISISSEEGVGSEISLILPYLPGKAEQLRATDKPIQQATTALRGKRALVADDEPYNRELIRVILNKWGVTSELVEDGTLSIQALQNDTYDFVLMDLQMPKMDGLEATQRIRADLKLELPIIALTATSTPADRQKCLEVGMNGMILKPFREAELYQQLVELLEIDVSNIPEEVLAVESESVPMPTQSSAEYAFDELYELANRDKGFMLNMLNIFVESAQVNLQEMKEASAASDWDAVSMKAHKLIPPCRHLGLDELVVKLKQLERKAGNETPSQDLPDLVTTVDERIGKIIAAIKEDMKSL